ncbi:MAG: hypothetical protein HOF70_08925 [Rhodospirillaceae bacterium]|nr:hypothetical protein [Rhodospirillaceae bacterium]MBT3884891.1 hypothetical protein [Rhodospirillaceae bacterium]MBT4117220.1 hypothetical protein [Rhodospirillaceae bacterium]MBT4674853.1 hypothetical protein [Rhodospirillaceae bacterium]MBT4718566.1 hypothetical protein [Rhodospirillaceae bacterium]
MARTKNELLQLLAEANKKLMEYAQIDKSIGATLDHVLARLESEYESSVALQAKVVEMADKLVASGQDHDNTLKELEQVKAALNISLDRLDSIRNQVEAAKILIATNEVDMHEVDARLDKIKKTADVTIISINDFDRPRYRH